MLNPSYNHKEKPSEPHIRGLFAFIRFFAAVRIIEKLRRKNIHFCVSISFQFTFSRASKVPLSQLRTSLRKP